MSEASTPEHRPLLTGRGRYLDDIRPADALHLAFVRSPWPHARIRNVDADRARRAPGVAAVVTGAELAGTVAPIRAEMEAGGSARYRATDWHPVAARTVRYVGEIVAVVAARDRYMAEDASALVDVEYEPLPVVGDAVSAIRGGATQVHEHAPDNVLFRTEWTSGKKDRFEQAPIRVRFTCRHPRVSGMPMEACGAVASYDRANGTLDFSSSTQVPHILRDGLARCLGISAGRIRVAAPNVGGGFGPKMQLFPEEVAAAALAVRLGRAVKWVQDRMEHLQAAFHSRDVTVEAEAAAEADGRIAGLRAQSLCDVGAYSSFPLGCSLDPQTAGVALPGPYRVPYYHYIGLAVATHKFPTGAYRGVGVPLGPLVTEELVSRIGRAAGLDPVEVRRRNLLRPDELPHESPGGSVYDSGDYPALLQGALGRAPYDGWREERRKARCGAGNGARRRLGIGMSCFVEATGMNRAVYRKRGMAHVPAFDSAVLRIEPGGGVEAFVSTPSQGQGHHESFRRLVGRGLGVPEESVRVVLGDTAVTPYGSGTFASRSMVSGGGAVLSAAAKMKERLCAVAAARWELDARQVRFIIRDGAGGVERTDAHATTGAGIDRMATHGPSAKGPAPALGSEGAASASAGDGSAASPRGAAGTERLEIAELAHLAHTPFLPLPAGVEPGLEVHAAYDPPGVPVSCAAHVALVEVDRLTGGARVLRYVVAEDCGPIVNVAAVDGQIRGAVAQGIGCALLESVDYDEGGQHRSATLMDYLVPAVGDVPDIDIVHMETPSPFTESGIKGMGESGIIGAPAAVVNAVLDALGVSPSGLVLPLTPERIVALAAAGRDPDPTS
ncbi:MAG: xanthine dehydrogenase family protein molybdopterin-binding subunit [Immundisolibacterales bacterium]|nr:xanthine dehydrogenase family protein molybdopterin-binding subunit [Immundisolibacterales bacterium]